MPAEDYLTVEDGSGVAGANSWLTLAEVDAYHLAINRTAWAALSEEARVAALIIACRYMVAAWEFIGEHDRGRLPFPATSAYDHRERLVEGVPQEVKDAQAELAYDHAVTGNALDEVYTRPVSAVQAGPVRVEFPEWAPSTPVRTLVEGMLAPVTQSGPGGFTVPLSLGLYG